MIIGVYVAHTPATSKDPSLILIPMISCSVQLSSGPPAKYGCIVYAIHTSSQAGSHICWQRDSSQKARPTNQAATMEQTTSLRGE